jgi:hypothetical protein
MPGFASYDDLIQEMTVNGKQFDWDFFKVAPANAQAAGSWQRLWTGVGSPGPGAEPAATPGSTYTQVAGSMNWPNVSTDLAYLVTLGAAANQNCTLMLYDRLAGVSGLSLAATGAKTVNSSALPRYSGAAAAAVQAWLEITTATTTTAPVVNLNSYTNEAGVTGRAGGNITFPAAATVLHAMIGPMPLQAGDKGIRSVEVGLNVGTAAAAGACNLILLRPLAYLPLIANQWNERDLILQLGALPRVFDGASLGLAILASGAVTTTVWGKVRLAYG